MLNGKQTAFTSEYLKDLNGAQAAIRAGYSAKSARIQAAQLLTKPNIREKIDAAIDERANRARIDADWVIKKLVQNYRKASKAKKFSAVNRALELLGKHLGMFKTTVDLNVKSPPFKVIIHL